MSLKMSLVDLTGSVAEETFDAGLRAKFKNRKGIDVYRNRITSVENDNCIKGLKGNRLSSTLCYIII